MILIRYAEIGTKGRNRGEFENKLVENIKDCLVKNNINAEISKIRGRIFIHYDKNIPQLANVFGIHSFSLAEEAEADLDEIKNKAFSMLKNKRFSTFRISTQRIEKKIAPSNEISASVGKFIIEKLNKKVDLHNFDIELNIEIADNAYLFTEKQKAVGGLPLGIEGSVNVLVSDESSLLAAFLVMKRGCSVNLIAFEKKNIDLLKKYAYGQDINLKIVKEIPKDLPLVVNDDLENLKDYDVDLVLRPLVAFSSNEVKKMLSSL